jgi:hypothetical protein
METRIAVVLDESSSMGPLTNQTISGLNEYLNDRKIDQLASKDDVTISILSFNTTRSNWLYRNQNVQSVEPLTTQQYRPYGGTPLYDAIKDLIEDLSKTSCSHNRNFVVIITDGDENASRTSRQEVFELVSKKKNENWTFTFIGANMDSFKAAGGIGIDKGNVANYRVNDTRGVYAAMSNVTRGFTQSSLTSSAAAMALSVDGTGNKLGNAVDVNGNIIVNESGTVTVTSGSI